MGATPYVETEILLAVMNEDEASAHELLSGMYDAEIVAFAWQLDQLMHMIRRFPTRANPGGGA